MVANNAASPDKTMRMEQIRKKTSKHQAGPVYTHARGMNAQLSHSTNKWNICDAAHYQ